MKKNILAFLLILITVSVFAQKHSQRDLIGKWEGRDARSDVGGLFFLKDSKVILSMGGSFSPAMSYTVDFKSNPIKIDLFMKNTNGIQMTMKGLLQFVDKNTLKFQVFPRGDRTPDFDPKSSQNLVLLKRAG